MMNWLWSTSLPMMLAEMAAIAVGSVSLSLLSIPCYVNARHLWRMRFDPEYRRKREAISRHVADIAEACDQLQAAYREAAARDREEPALRLVEDVFEDEVAETERRWGFVPRGPLGRDREGQRKGGAARDQEEPALRLVEPCGEDEPPIR